jgi:hypothetical protein
LQKSNTNAAGSTFAGETFGGGGFSGDTGLMDNLDLIVDKVQFRITTQFELALQGKLERDDFDRYSLTTDQ